MLAVRTTGPCLELPVVDRGLGVLSTRAITVMLDAANATSAGTTASGTGE